MNPRDNQVDTQNENLKIMVYASPRRGCDENKELEKNDCDAKIILMEGLEDIDSI